MVELESPPTVEDLYKNWFLDYASYVILERAVPNIEDGLKPVQRRILHALKEIDDGRFNKVANIIGSTMQYHPHGDAAIYEAIVNLGQKNLLIETQGNWGDARTGDSAAAARYIEARLSKFAQAILYNPDITTWQRSYDGRKKEPLQFPCKFPILLVQGVEGIAVGLATKILPHNFCEVIEASIAYLKGEDFDLKPDFPTGGLADCSQYKRGLKGGKVRSRAKISVLDKKTVCITEIPFGTTTEQLIQSIIKANETGKIKIKQISNNTAEKIAIEIKVAPGHTPENLIAALYAFTNCENVISPNNCVILDEKPHFLAVDEILKYSADRTKALLEQELTIQRNKLQERLFFIRLEQIFIERKIYRRLENALTWEDVLKIITRNLTRHIKHLYRPLQEEDVVRLTEIKVKRISKYDTFKTETLAQDLTDQLAQTQHHLENLTAYTIAFYANLRATFGADHPRQTQLAIFDTIVAQSVAAINTKLFVNRKTGFIGSSLKKEEFVTDCSDIDEILVILKDGTFNVSLMSEKAFVGRDILHIAIFNRKRSDQIYHLIYREGQTGYARVKKFEIKSIVRDKSYPLWTPHRKSKLLYLNIQSKSEPEPIVDILLHANCTARTKTLYYDFENLSLKGRASQGNVLTKYPVRRVKKASKKVIEQLKLV